MDPSQGTSNPVARYAPTEYVLPSTYNCHDFTEFKDLLLLLRKSNDNFKFMLNKMNSPTQCEDVWRQMNQVSSYRRQAIQDCLAQSQAHIDALNIANNNANNAASTATNSKKNTKNNESNQVNNATTREIKRITQKMDLLRSEQDIEDILHRQAEKLFHRACPSYVFQNPPS